MEDWRHWSHECNAMNVAWFQWMISLYHKQNICVGMCRLFGICSRKFCRDCFVYLTVHLQLFVSTVLLYNESFYAKLIDLGILAARKLHSRQLKFASGTLLSGCW